MDSAPSQQRTSSTASQKRARPGPDLSLDVSAAAAAAAGSDGVGDMDTDGPNISGRTRSALRRRTESVTGHAASPAGVSSVEAVEPARTDDDGGAGGGGGGDDHLGRDPASPVGHCNIFMSEDALTNTDTLLLIIQGMGAVRYMPCCVCMMVCDDPMSAADAVGGVAAVTERVYGRVPCAHRPHCSWGPCCPISNEPSSRVGESLCSIPT